MNKRISFLLLLLFLFFAISAPALALTTPDIEAGAAYLMELESGTVLYTDNADARMYPASTTKMMTAILVMDACANDLDEKVTFTEDALEGLADTGSAVYFSEGETLSVRELLYSLLVVSSNDAANMLAIHCAGSIPAFVDKMNARAAELGCTNTHFSNANGLHEENHYSCATDLARIAQEMLKYDTLVEMAGTDRYVLPATNKSEERIFYSTNNLISHYRTSSYLYDKATGLKTGSTTPAGYCLVATAEDGDLSLLSIVLNCKTSDSGKIMSFTESKKLLEWGFQNFELQDLISADTPVAEASVLYARKKSATLPLYPKTDVKGAFPRGVNTDTVESVITLQEDITAPVEVGTELGTLSLVYQGEEVVSVPLVNQTEAELSRLRMGLAKLTEKLHDGGLKWALILVAVILILIILFLRRKRRKYRRRNVFYRRRRNW